MNPIYADAEASDRERADPSQDDETRVRLPEVLDFQGAEVALCTPPQRPVRIAEAVGPGPEEKARRALGTSPKRLSPRARG